MCGYDPARLAIVRGRFSAPVFPGETIRTEMWRDGDIVSFRARVVERDVVAINNGRAEVRSMTEAADLAPIREAVRALCADFPGEYWRTLDRERAYPAEFVAALTKAGFLAALIPEEYGGSGLTMSAAAAIMEEIQAVGLQRRRLPRADVHDGHGAAARQRRAEAALSAGDRARRVAAAGVRRHRADLGHRYAQPAHHGRARRRSLYRQRPEDLDLACRAFRSDAAAGAHHAARGGEVAHRRAFGFHRRHARSQSNGPDHPPDPHHDEPRHHRSVLREYAGAGGQPDRQRRAKVFATSSPA